MLQISEAMFSAMTELSGQNFRSFAARHVQARLGQTAEADAARIADHAIALGESLDIVSSGDMIKFIDLVLQLGPGFETRAEYAPVMVQLHGPGPGWQRINRVHMLLEGSDPARAEAAFFQPPQAAHG